MPKKINPRNPEPSAPTLVVAIGASAGGIEAVTELLQNLSPTTGLAFVYIQHLDPEYDSNLAAILSRVTTMPVVVAQHQLRIEPNHLYVIPPDQDMEVIDGALTLLPRQAKSSMHMPIDQFFISLAERQKNSAIGIVLSGVASDGTLGLRAIKVAGGLTFAQDGSARFQSMPRSAISEGVVDMVMAPANIARELERLSRLPQIFQPLDDETTDIVPEITTDEDDIKAIIKFLRRTTGVDFTYYKITTIRRRIIRRMLLHKLNTLQEYAEYLKQHPDETSLLYNDLLINVTTFFRDEHTMEYIKKELLPRMISDKLPRTPLRIWVAACSTGQEAYSLAILLLEVLGDQGLSIPIQLFATDLSEAAIAKARHGSYTRSEVADVSPKRLQRFFTKVDDHYRINKSVRDLCVFAPHNVLKDPPFSRLDLISCRNLLIYLDGFLQKKSIATFHYALNPDGYLFLGKSETVSNSATLFAQLDKSHKVFARKNDVVSRASFDMALRLETDGQTEPSRSNELRSSPLTRKTNMSFGSTNDLDKLVDSLLMQRLPPSVVVNQDLDILQFRGSTGLFLEPAPGKASLNLLKMARPSLVFELRNTVHKARKAKQTVRKTGLEVKVKDKTHHVAIEAIPIRTDLEEQLFIIVFEEVLPIPGSVTDPADVRNVRIKQLEEELATLREDMRSIIEDQEASNEELQSANEEIISSNEELQSINEELETSKEEIESTNEELLTINQELQVRNDQLSEANEYSEAIFTTIREATLVLDEDLRVKSANKTFYKLFGVSQEEIEGKLIYELGNRQWDIPQLRLLLSDALRHNTEVEGFEVRHTFPQIGEKILLLNARRVTRQQEAILLAIEDITDHRQVQRLIEEREAWLHNLIDKAPVLIWVTNQVGNYTFFNKALLDYTALSLEDATSHGWIQAIHPDDQEAYLATFNEAAAKYEHYQAEYRLRRHDGEYYWVLENAKPSFAPAGDFTGYIGTCAEIYNRRTVLQALDKRTLQRIDTLLQVKNNLEQAKKEQTQLEPNTEPYRLSKEHVQQLEKQLQRMMDNTSDVITRWDTSLRLLFANSSFESKTGVPNADLLGKTNLEIGQPPEIAQPYMATLREVIRTGNRQNHYNSFPTPKGIIYFYSTMIPELSDDGSVKSVLVIARDISNLWLVEEIQQISLSLQAILDSSPAAIALFKPIRELTDEATDKSDQVKIVDFQLAVCNHKFAELVNQPIDQLVGQTMQQLASSLWQENTFGEFLTVLTTGQSTYIEQQNGDRWMGISLMKQDDGVVLTGLDISSLKLAEQQQELWMQEVKDSQGTIQSLQELRKQLRERGEFLRATTHDLRGNFGVIQGAATLLDMMDTDEDRAQMLMMLQRNLRQATDLLTQLLDYSRLEAGQERVELVSFDAANTLCELAESMRPLANERNLELFIDGPKELWVEGDAIKIKRIAQNLILNALKYTPSGKITVTWGLAEEQPDHWYFSVEDTGPGLSPGVIQSLTSDANDPTGEITNSDTQLGESTYRAISGEGIGLVIVKNLCKLLRATIDIKSETNTGTLFQIYLLRQ
ncbi:CheR family methyltransferase [Spirosoma soli]|uniref:CheR family methyltransferase n=1 Tax=Spirosoma soli TaxID=1770529 RepID=A0ABW5M565_9BACT